MQLEKQRRDWEDLSELDPFWAILSDPSRQHGGWEREDFLRRGEEDVGDVLARAAEHGLPARHGRALDFGCGAGRLTRALSTRFDHVVGVDVSAPMVELARGLHADRPNLEFVVNAREDLATFGDASFDMVLTEIVLQHVATRAAMLRYVQELGRVLAPGGLLAMQIPSHIPPLRRVQARPRLYGALRTLGVPAPVLYRRLRLQPMRMRFAPVDEVRRTLAFARVDVVAVDTVVARGGTRSSSYLATRRGA